MCSLTFTVIALALCACGACATAPASPSVPPHERPLAFVRVEEGAGADSAGTMWGDEYDEPVEMQGSVRAARGISAEHVEGATQSTRVDAHARGASVRVRSSPRGEVGVLTWRGTGRLREVAVGHVEPSVAQGALAGDTRASADLRAPGSVHVDGLRMKPSASPWSAARGVGMVAAFGEFRASVGGCEAHDESSRRFAFAGLEHGVDGVTVGVAAGARIDGRASPAGVSLSASRADDVTFAAAEVAVANGRTRGVARLVAGERREWSAVAIAGAGPARDSPLVFARRERWGAALERRDAWRWGEARAGVSTLLRRDDVSDIHRRRAFWDGTWFVGPGVRLELAARITREESVRPESGPLASLPAHETYDDWRARATLRAGNVTGNGWIVENAYRLEWVQNRSGQPGTIATWTCRLRAGALDGRISATAHALHRGQVGYDREPAPLATSEYAALAGKGAAVTGSLRVWLRRHAWLGATWSRRPPAEARVWVMVGVRT